VIFGAGTAGIGIADQLTDAMTVAGLTLDEARSRLWCVDKRGLLTDDMDDLLDFQQPYARPKATVASWARDDDLAGIGLAEVVRRVEPTILIGTSGRASAFTEPIVRQMARNVERPVILPMSNPTRLSEATPADLLAWTDGRALVATGSPFGPVRVEGTTYEIAQVNNALVFPGLGLGVVVSRASRITDNMLFAAAEALAGTADPTRCGAPLLPPVADLRRLSAIVAGRVATAAAADGVARQPAQDLASAVARAMWEPVYRPVLAS
jgi:malate dehydrogenase (oxaloacetate-decarboxylating)